MAMSKTPQRSVAQLALAWVLAQGRDIEAIPGTRRLARLQENIGALPVELNTDEIKLLNMICVPEAFAGERFGLADMARIAQ